MEKLNDDILGLVFGRLSDDDRKSCSLVNKIWYKSERTNRVRVLIPYRMRYDDIRSYLERFPNASTLRIDSVIPDETLDFISTTFRKLKTLNMSTDLCRGLDPSLTDFGDKGLALVAERCLSLTAVSLSCRSNIGNGGILELQHKALNLTSLDLSQCQWVSDTSIGVAANMASLSHLNIGSCPQVSDAGLQLLSSGPVAKKLKFLDISFCDRLTDVGVSFLRKLSILQELNLSYCGQEQLTDRAVIAIASISSIERLDLSGQAKITDATLIAVCNSCRDLSSLDVSLCTLLTDAFLGAAAHLHSLSQMFIKHCSRITDRGLRFLSKGAAARSLKVLDVNGCQYITDVGINHLRTLSFLEVLGLYFCANQELSDVSGLIIATFVNLRKLNLEEQNKITDDTVLVVAKNCHKLILLNLSSCGLITDKSLAAVARMGSISQLFLSDCLRLTDHGLELLSNGPAATSLRVLNISFCDGISDIGICSLERLSHLEKLMLRGFGSGHLRDSAGIAISSISSLRKLDMSLLKDVTNNTLIAVANNCWDLREIRLYGCEGEIDEGLLYLVSRLPLERIHMPKLSHLKKSGPSYILNLVEKCKSLRILKVDSGMMGKFSASQLAAVSVMCKLELEWL